MTGRVTQRPRSRLDLLEQFVYLGEQAGVEVAERYLAAVEDTCARLVARQLHGSPYDPGIKRLAGLPRLSVKGARDIESIFRIEEG
ncbi:MAG TPA: hypothetical protein VGZ73_24675 [Bryobacteraceae bacterium]|jgi:plasmid stabilization system protein ParE|nr:hypothetical protein [Bryobacteraceae bacterium]